MEYLLHGIEQGKNVTVIVTIKRRSLKPLKRRKHMRKMNIESYTVLRVRVM